ncbi:hypothetical protein [Pseudomonas sp. NFACC39-1]|uniref:hypothetical protein n=1 Tax=Pseudomonas sp. NFACC39-1 TaxID=1566195 RepID=UPI0008D6A52E|nr:hypothetical protein [Pseudomonas sp. NFACC39-1]SEN65196.1 hypothetical protein SAMN03159293_00631 [Pseudomonas sp. NFACC39-1]
MLKNALLLAAVALSLPVHAAQPDNVIFDWKLFHNGEQVDGQPPITTLLGGNPYPYRNLTPHRYNKSIVHEGNKIKTVTGYVTTGVELSFRPSWQDGVAFDYDISQRHLNGFTRLPGSLPIDRPDQRTYEARGSLPSLAVGETAVIRLACDLDIPVELCPYYVELKVLQVN